MENIIKIILAFIILTLVACSSLDKTQAINKNKLEVGVSKKDQVAHELGLPNKVDHVNNEEYWYYLSDALYVNYFIPIPLSAMATDGTNAGKTYNVYSSKPLPSGTYDVSYMNIGPSIKNDFKPSLICVFDSTGLLISIAKSEK